jgi:DNA (cytosine-5)-methyltransferase 1
MRTVLDLFCGGGGSGEGYAQDNCDVTGVDKFLQPENPHRFILSDWKTFVRTHGHEYDLIHAGPVCKGYAGVSTQALSVWEREIPIVRAELDAIGKPYIIENITSAGWDMKNPIMLCGSAFGLRVRRHRLFESNISGLVGSGCDHAWQDADKIYLRRGRYSKPTPTGVCPNNGDSLQLLLPDVPVNQRRATELKLRQEAMGIDWLSWKPLTQAIPPAFTYFLSRQITEGRLI